MIGSGFLFVVCELMIDLDDAVALCRMTCALQRAAMAALRLAENDDLLKHVSVFFDGAAGVIHLLSHRADVEVVCRVPVQLLDSKRVVLFLTSTVLFLMKVAVSYVSGKRCIHENQKKLPS